MSAAYNEARLSDARLDVAAGPAGERTWVAHTLVDTQMKYDAADRSRTSAFNNGRS